MANKALSFDGDNDYVTVSDHASMNWTTKVSAFAWVKPSDVTTSYMMIAVKYTSVDNNREWSLGAKLNGKLYVQFGDPNDGTYEGRQLTDNIVLANDTWAFIGFTYDAGTIKIYVDGSEVNSSLDDGAIPASLYNGTCDLIIGAWADHSNSWVGIIDEVIVTDDVISDAEITAIWNGGSGIVWTSDGNTVVLFHLDDETSPTDDASANSNDGTIVGASWVDGYPFPAVGYTGGNVDGVAAASIAAIDGVPTANIAKVDGV